MITGRTRLQMTCRQAPGESGPEHAWISIPTADQAGESSRRSLTSVFRGLRTFPTSMTGEEGQAVCAQGAPQSFSSALPARAASLSSGGRFFQVYLLATDTNDGAVRPPSARVALSTTGCGTSARRMSPRRGTGWPERSQRWLSAAPRGARANTAVVGALAPARSTRSAFRQRATSACSPGAPMRSCVSPGSASRS